MGKKPIANRPLVYARLRPMFGRDAGKPELFQITEKTLSIRKEVRERKSLPPGCTTPAGGVCCD